MHNRVGLLLSLLILLAVPAVANAQTGTGTLRIAQQGPDGGTITGGCYRAASEDDLRERCDLDDGATDGVVVLENLLPGEFTVRETNPPAGYRATADFTVAVGGATITRERRHEATPQLRVVTTDAGGGSLAGSCWLIRTPGETEGYVDRCDADDGADDGTTTFLDVAAGAYELKHLDAPAGLDRIDDTTFTMRDEDTTLTFALETAVAPDNTAPPTVGGGHAVGDELTGDAGTWTGSATITYADAWERCNLDGTGCTPTGDYDAHYTLGAEDAGLALRYRVTATNDAGKRTAVSALHTVSALRAPEYTTPPSVSGIHDARPEADRESRDVEQRARVHLPVAAVRSHLHGRRRRHRGDVRDDQERCRAARPRRRHRDQRGRPCHDRERADRADRRRPVRRRAPEHERHAAARRGDDRLPGSLDLALRQSAVRLPLAALRRLRLRGRRLRRHLRDHLRRRGREHPRRGHGHGRRRLRPRPVESAHRGHDAPDQRLAAGLRRQAAARREAHRPVRRLDQPRRQPDPLELLVAALRGRRHAMRDDPRPAHRRPRRRPLHDHARRHRPPPAPPGRRKQRQRRALRLQASSRT